jgi:two-component system cell cycle sensor histidine kinase/response regulator CckA
LPGPSDGLLRELVAALQDASDGADRVLQLDKEIRKLASAGGTADTKVLDLPDVLDMAVKLTSHVVGPDSVLERAYTVTPYVEANEAQLTQIFVNLLSNAAHALDGVPPGARRIVLATRTDDGGRAVVEVRDNGRGIPKKDLPHLFEPFFTTKPSGTGMGLGLSICQGIVSSLGGEISAESEPGHGAVFRVVLPPMTPRREPSSSSKMRAQAARRSRILVVDDEPVMAAAVQRVLGDEYDVTVESDPRLALARIATSEPFDVVLCDLRMPGMSGVDVYEAVAVSNPETARRLVFISADVTSAPAQKLLSTIANPVLVKPFSAESLRAIVKDYTR